MHSHFRAIKCSSTHPFTTASSRAYATKGASQRRSPSFSTKPHSPLRSTLSAQLSTFITLRSTLNSQPSPRFYHRLGSLRASMRRPQDTHLPALQPAQPRRQSMDTRRTAAHGRDMFPPQRVRHLRRNTLRVRGARLSIHTVFVAR